MITSAKTPDLILHNGRITTLDKAKPVATAVAIHDGRFAAVGGDAEILSLAGPATNVIDLKGRSALPGLIDNHTHVVRGGLNPLRHAGQGPKTAVSATESP
ncbi:amidohydrolase family protein [Cupriavidus necator]|uniref:amidohydrolase family protein n=1 Tax=Cupriavidus necator TaxID=106590 RepID=UPI0005B3BFC4|nr:amidohydrolase family protein [Cupriavidus necator]